MCLKAYTKTHLTVEFKKNNIMKPTITIIFLLSFILSCQSSDLRNNNPSNSIIEVNDRVLEDIKNHNTNPPTDLKEKSSKSESLLNQCYFNLNISNKELKKKDENFDQLWGKYQDLEKDYKIALEKSGKYDGIIWLTGFLTTLLILGIAFYLLKRFKFI